MTAEPGHSFLDKMIGLAEGAERQKTPNEIALNILLAGFTIIFLLAVVTLRPFAIYSGAPQSVFVLVALLVCLIPTTIRGLLSAIGIAGMDRLVQRNVLAMSGRAVEAAGDVHTLQLDNTGTITFGNRQAAEFVPLPVYVETPQEKPGRIKPYDSEALHQNIALAQSLGATVVKVHAERPAEGLIAFAQREGITHVIFGQSARSRWEILWHGSTIDRFLGAVRDAAVQVVPLDDQVPA